MFLLCKNLSDMRHIIFESVASRVSKLHEKCAGKIVTSVNRRPNRYWCFSGKKAIQYNVNRVLKRFLVNSRRHFLDPFCPFWLYHGIRIAKSFLCSVKWHNRNGKISNSSSDLRLCWCVVVGKTLIKLANLLKQSGLQKAVLDLLN